VAGGVFAPGHLGELTRIVPFEMVDAVLAEAGGCQERIRVLPSRVVVYLLLAAGLFESLGYLAVWRRLIAGLDGLGALTPSGSSLWQARRRVGVAPVRALFDLLRGSAATSLTGQARWCGLLVAAIDGTTLEVPDSAANLRRMRKMRNQHGTGGYPQVRLVMLVACGTRAVIDASFGPAGVGERCYAADLVRSVHAGMIVLLDRGFDGNDLIKELAGSRGHVLVRLCAGRRPRALERYRDGSYLALVGAIRMRVVECEITITTRAGRRTGVYRLATTLLDANRHPAFELVRLYHERWEIESAYLEIKHTILGGRVLRSRDPDAIAQEVYALLSVYQVLRIAMADATDTSPDADPDRASFTIALQAARDQVVKAANVIADTTIDLVGAIGRQILDNLLPARRLRVSPRAVKRPISKYAYQSLRINRASYKATLSIDILAGQHLSTNPPAP
jgi:Insertion element 4 transposase N-terminal/Transposase DDE domain